MTTRRGLAIGCGGILGFAWTVAALDAVERALDWDVRDAEVLVGTSAGAEIVAALGSGRTPTALLAALDATPDADPVLAGHVAVDPGALPPLPGLGLPGRGLVAAGLRRGSAYTALAGLLPRGRGDAAWLRAFGHALADPTGWVPHPATWLVAADAATGERIAFGADNTQPGTPAVSAAHRVPGATAAADRTGGEPRSGAASTTGSNPGVDRAALDTSAGAQHPASDAAARAQAQGGAAQVAEGGAGGRGGGSGRVPAVGLGDAIAASWAIPGWFPPVRIGERDYVDGGAVSSVSADLLVPLGLDEVVVVAPMTSAGGEPATGLDRAERLLRGQMTRGLDREVALLRAAGTRVIRVEPSAVDLAVMGPNFMDFRRRAATLEIARRTTPARVAAAIRAAHEGVDL
ncbi:patatin-like phospholipase family protein [Nocardia sp. NPDC059177]|uniref:patatin-like phospholipase family protein n=1 Tax=Nocardia sp. NPDC059177 TaxID=3346759 RepID=UPI00367B8053